MQRIGEIQSRPQPQADGAGELSLPLSRSLRSGPIVGRERQLERLRELWRTRADGLVLVLGEPGVGKTRLLAELASGLAAHGACVLYGRCDPELAAPFAPLVEALRGAGVRLAGLPAAHRLLLARLLPELELERPVPVLEHDLEAGQRQRLFDAIAAALTLAAAPAGAALLLDDLHWADPSTLLLLADLARRGPEFGALLIGGSREPDPDLGTLLPETVQRIAARSPVHELRLTGLDEDELMLAAEGWEGHAVTRALAVHLRALTNGNPFLSRNTLRHLQRSGLMDGAGEPPADAVARAGAQLVAPDVRAIVARQLDALGAAAGELLAAGAVLGRDFAAVEAAEAAGIDPEQAVRLTERAVQAGLLEELGERLLVRFEHALVQEAVLAGLSAGRRALLHLRAGETIERRTPADRRVTELALHFGAALELGGAERALRYARAAAHQASEQLAFAEAASMHELALRALEQLPDRDEWERYDELIALGHAHYRAMGRPRSLEAFAQAAAIAQRANDAQRLARAALGVGLERYLAVSGTADERVTAPLELVLAMPEGLDARLRLRCRAMLLLERCFVAPLREREAELAAIEAAAQRADDPDLLLDVLTTRYVVLWHPRHTASLLQSVDASIARARERARVDVVMHLHCTAFGYAAELGDREALEHHLAGGQRAAAETGAAVQRVRTAALEIVRMIVDGRLAQASRAADRFRGDSDIVGPEFGLYIDTLWRFVLARERGELAAVKPALELIAAAVPDDPLVGAVLAQTEARLGEHAAARERLARVAGAGFADVKEDFNWLGTLTAAATTAALLGERGYAEGLLELLRPWAGRNSILGVAALGCPVAHALGLLERLRGDRAAALLLFERAASDARVFGAPLWRAEALCELGMTLRREGRPAQARTPLREALDLADACGASALAARAGEELRAAGARPRRMRSTGTDALTAAERRVAELAAAGHTNAEIARRLVLGARTVETHLTRVYRKLGIGGRRELAAALADGRAR